MLYQWQAGDTDSAGVYEVEVKLVYSSGRPQYLPSRSFMLVVIEPGLA